MILASTSPARRALLASLGLPFDAVAPGVDESVPPGTAVDDAVAMLAERKARAVAATRPDEIVIGSDQLAEIDGEPLGKPADRDAARAQVGRLLGRTHRIVTAVCVIAASRADVVVDSARLTFRALSPADLERYLDLGEWEGCAGGYRIESRGQALLERLEGDRTTVQGLPMIPLVRMLRAVGVDLLAPSR